MASRPASRVFSPLSLKLRSCFGPPPQQTTPDLSAPAGSLFTPRPPPTCCIQVVLYSLPELDGAIDTVVLGGLVGDTIGLVPERVRKMNERIKGWVDLRRTPEAARKVAVIVYGFPPNVGAVSESPRMV